MPDDDTTITTTGSPGYGKSGGEVVVLAQLVDRERLAARGVDLATEALTDGRARLSWGDYADRVAHLASVLGDAGVRRGDRVGVHVANPVDSFVGVHAVLRSGGVVVPIDPLAPPAHLADVLADAGVDVLVSDASDRAAVGGGRTTVVRPDADETVRPDSTHAAAAGVAPDDPAYIIYTSGSTGRPKGIVHSNRSALAYAELSRVTYGIVAGDRITNIAPLHFDQSTFALYAAPLVGAATIAVPAALSRFPASLSRLLDAERATVVYTVPYLLDQLATRGVLADRELGAMRWVLFGGEPFPVASLRALMAALPGARFSNVYGPAEVNQCTFFHLDEPPVDDEPVPIGRAWADTEVAIVDGLGQPVPLGRPGELLVATTTMMIGYRNLPQLTATAISERPAADGSMRRWYATGDLVVERPDGNIVFLGRIDNQVKLRGHRVELESIDAVLTDHPLVDAGVAVLDRRIDDEDRIVALVVAAPEHDGEADVVAELAAELGNRLPRIAVPTEIVLVASLPRTASAKVDRGAALEQWRAHRSP